jgi:hypothetical protein
MRAEAGESMRLFFHHVGQKGADEDFKKTVYKEVSIETVGRNIPTDDPLRVKILQVLQAQFPSGRFNCWGVPAGAKLVIRQIAEGDFVLLVESATEYGEVPVLCQVQAFWPHELRNLSLALWGNDKFPYIFFFRTEKVTLSWPELREYLGYRHNFDPRGNFYSVASHRLDDFGGVEAYIEGLRHNYAEEGSIFAPVTKEELLQLDGAEYLDEAEVTQALTISREELEQPPSLTDEADQEMKQVSLKPRDAKFRILVRRAYSSKCAVCGSGVRSPKDEAEVESAHIYPKKMSGKDHPRNGLCLCRRHHWALDVGWISLSDDHMVLVRDDLPAHPDYEFIRRYAGTKILLPTDEKATPHPVFLQAHRKLMGFE